MLSFCQFNPNFGALQRKNDAMQHVLLLVFNSTVEKNNDGVI
jgi:hypothetical protein